MVDLPALLVSKQTEGVAKEYIPKQRKNQYPTNWHMPRFPICRKLPPNPLMNYNKLTTLNRINV